MYVSQEIKLSDVLQLAADQAKRYETWMEDYETKVQENTTKLLNHEDSIKHLFNSSTSLEGFRASTAEIIEKLPEIQDNVQTDWEKREAIKDWVAITAKIEGVNPKIIWYRLYARLEQEYNFDVEKHRTRSAQTYIDVAMRNNQIGNLYKIMFKIQSDKENK